MTHPIIGTHNGHPLALDLERLIDSRLLVQARSGGGKSWLNRRLAEQTYGRVQQIILDSEGEFSSLRERHDYIVAAAQGGDTLAHPRTAALLARRLLELGVSAIVDIYELKAHERPRFIKLFLDSMMNAPKALWHPVMVVLDEAHNFCPQSGSSESMQAVIDLATRGRKRGFCAVLATQRLSKLHKDAAAEMQNKLIGGTSLDVDVKRAADELGMTARDAVEQLRNLQPGEFFAYGPALSQTVVKIMVGKVETTHPKAGQRTGLAPIVAPSRKITEALSKLADLPREAEAAEKSLAELQRENADLKRRLTLAAKAPAPAPAAPAKPVTIRETREVPNPVNARMLDHLHAIAKLATPYLKKREIKAATPAERKFSTVEGAPAETLQETMLGRVFPEPLSPFRAPAARATGQVVPEASLGLKPAHKRVLAELAAKLPDGYSPRQLAALCGYSMKGGGFNNILGRLKTTGMVERRHGLAIATDAALAYLGDAVPAKPTTHEDALAQWQPKLGEAKFRVLTLILEAGKDGIARDDLAAAVGMSGSGGGFNNKLGRLNTLGLIERHGGRLYPSDLLFPEGRP